MRDDLSRDTFVRIGAIRGRNPDNPTSRIPGQETVQIFEENDQPIANCLTRVNKDTMIKFDYGDKSRIRRLTELECERLQGFPDHWTSLGIYGDEERPVAASNRQKCLGNAVTVDVVAAVGRSIIENTDFDICGAQVS